MMLCIYSFSFFFSFFWGWGAASGLSCSAASWLQCSSFSLVVVCGFSLCSCGTQAPGCMGSVVCGVQALLLRHASSAVLVHGLNCPAACGILVPRPGIEPASPALEGGFFTTGPPGKSQASIHMLLAVCISS